MEETMKILVTGAKGMLGQDLCPILEDEGYEVIETDVDSLDITKEEDVNNALLQMQPNVVIHCAAYTNVDKAEEEPDLARLINVKGTENLANVCKKMDIPLVLISTDYVFDGNIDRNYTPDDVPNPINKYGLTKLEAEQAVQSICEKYYIVRTSWLYGHHGKNFVETMISLKDKDVLNVVDDQIGCPTWSVDLSNGLVDLLDEEPEYGIYHICGGGQTSWYGFAKEIFSQLGFNVNLKPCLTEDFPRAAKRPKKSVIDNGVCRDWKEALKEYLELRGE